MLWPPSSRAVRTLPGKPVREVEMSLTKEEILDEMQKAAVKGDLERTNALHIVYSTMPYTGLGVAPPSPAEDLNDRIDHWFTHHPPPDNETIDAYLAVREAGRDLARVIADLCPRGADKFAAIRKVREAVMTANASIACGGK